MYNHLAVVIRLPDGTITRFVIPVRRGVRQGALTSPVSFNNCILNAQSSAVPSCILKGIDVLLIAYADDIFNPSRAVQSFERNFAILSKEYATINLIFNREKLDMVLCNWGETRAGFTVNLDSVQGFPKSQMKYLGLPIGDTLKATRTLLILHFQRRTATTEAWYRKSIEAYNSRVGWHLWSVILIQWMFCFCMF